MTSAPALTGTAAISKQIRQRVASILERYRDFSRPAAKLKVLADFDSLINEVEPIIGQSLADSIAGNYLAGATASLDALPAGFFVPPTATAGGAPPIKPPNVPSLLAPNGDGQPRVMLDVIEAAAKKLSSKEVMTASDFYNLAADARQRAFTVSGDLTAESRNTLRAMLVNELEEGPSFTGFKQSVREAFDALPISDSHLEMVFRNNINSAFSDGKEDILNHPMVSDWLPYRLYAPIGDGRARPEHIALGSMGLNGTAVYHKDDPTWLRFRPPWDWGCRCKSIALSVRDAARRGVQEAIEWLETGIEPAHPWVEPPPFLPPASWNRTAFAGAA